jgi:hypothetical protein
MNGRVGAAQNKGADRAMKIKVLAQFRETIIVEEGSNTENKLVIIFKLGVLFFCLFLVMCAFLGKGLGGSSIPCGP